MALGDGAFAPGPAVWVGRREVAHADADGMLDVRLTRSVIRARRNELRTDPRIILRGSSSDWLAVRVGTAVDVDFALSLLDDAVAANVTTAEPGPPPAGSDLARRSRFH